MVEQTNNVPSGYGFEVVEFLEINLSNLKLKKKNKKTKVGFAKELLTNGARAKGVKKERVREHAENILNGKYIPSYEPPIVERIEGTDEFQVLTGENRKKGHDVASQRDPKITTMFCAVVKFTKEKIKVDGITNELTPQACRVAKQSTENKENSNYVDDPRDIEDILVSLSQLQDEGVFDLEGEEKEVNKRINLVLLNLLEVPTQDHKRIRDKYYVIKEKGGLVAVKDYDPQEKKDFVKKYYPHITISTPKNPIEQDGVYSQIKTLNGGFNANDQKPNGALHDLDYDPRLFHDGCFILSKYNFGFKEVQFITGIGGRNSQEVEKLRDFKQTDMIKYHYERCLRIVCDVEGIDIKDLKKLSDPKKSKYNPMEQIKFKFLPQIQGEDMEKFVDE